MILFNFTNVLKQDICFPHLSFVVIWHSIKQLLISERHRISLVHILRVPVSLSLLVVTCRAGGGFTPAPMHSSRQNSVYQSLLEWMLAALVFNSSWRPKATWRLTRVRTLGFIISRMRRERRTCGKKQSVCIICRDIRDFFYFNIWVNVTFTKYTKTS